MAGCVISKFIIRAVKMEMKTTSFHQFHKDNSISGSASVGEASERETCEDIKHGIDDFEN